jgi:hypothetical protein
MFLRGRLGDLVVLLGDWAIAFLMGGMGDRVFGDAMIGRSRF